MFSAMAGIPRRAASASMKGRGGGTTLCAFSIACARGGWLRQPQV